MRVCFIVTLAFIAFMAIQYWVRGGYTLKYRDATQFNKALTIYFIHLTASNRTRLIWYRKNVLNAKTIYSCTCIGTGHSIAQAASPYWL